MAGEIRHHLLFIQFIPIRQSDVPFIIGQIDIPVSQDLPVDGHFQISGFGVVVVFCILRRSGDCIDDFLNSNFHSSHSFAFIIDSGIASFSDFYCSLESPVIQYFYGVKPKRKLLFSTSAWPPEPVPGTADVRHSGGI